MLNLQSSMLLFFKDYEKDSVFPNDRYVKRLIRPIYNKLHKNQKVSGFQMWFKLLVKSLRNEGYQVFINRYDLARQHPNFPVGILGYPHILDEWELANPAVLGPGLYDHPAINPKLMEDDRFKFYLLTCQWMYDLFQPYYGDKCGLWFAGMDLDVWPDAKKSPKDIDVLIYDKIRWNRELYERELLFPIVDFVKSKNLKFSIIRYGYYDHQVYKELLSKSRTMIFLCEHETQGMAYQEAMASNLPILAWDNGYWLDPNRSKYDSSLVRASSVPYFSDLCGKRFEDINEFYKIFNSFWEKRDVFEPRNYVDKELSMKNSAEKYHYYYKMAST